MDRQRIFNLYDQVFCKAAGKYGKVVAKDSGMLGCVLVREKVSNNTAMESYEDFERALDYNKVIAYRPDQLEPVINTVFAIGNSVRTEQTFRGTVTGFEFVSNRVVCKSNKLSVNDRQRYAYRYTELYVQVEDAKLDLAVHNLIWVVCSKNPVVGWYLYILPTLDKQQVILQHAKSGVVLTSAKTTTTVKEFVQFVNTGIWAFSKDTALISLEAMPHKDNATLSGIFGAQYL